MMFTIANPLWLLLVPAPILVRVLTRPYRETRAAVRAPWFARLAEFVGRTPEEGSVVAARSPLRAAAGAVVWLLVVGALAGPQLLLPAVSRTVPTRDLLLAVDLSGSMETEDFTSASGERVTRLEAVKEVLEEFVARREGDRVGLIVFGDAAFVQVPFTTDLAVVTELLRDTVPRMAGPKTAFGDAIGLSFSLFAKSEVEAKVLIALTDGNDTGSRVPPVEAARIAADRGITIHTVAVGDPAAAGEEKLDEITLEEVAGLTEGRFFRAADREELAGIYVELDRIETRKIETVSHRPRRDLWTWPFGLALLIGLGLHVPAGLAGWRRS